MIRNAAAADRDVIVDVAIQSTLFAAGDESFLEQMVTDHLERGVAEGRRMYVVEGDAGVAGVAYCQPESAAEGVWDLTMIAVRATSQGNGYGTELMHHVEQELRAEGERLLLVETSSTDTFIATRAFYTRLGYGEEARVRDYWADGDDLVLFRKDLRA